MNYAYPDAEETERDRDRDRDTYTHTQLLKLGWQYIKNYGV